MEKGCNGMILKAMTELHSLFTVPRVTIKEGKVDKIEYVWNNDRAKEIYENLKEMLCRLRSIESKDTEVFVD